MEEDPEGVHPYATEGSALSAVCMARRDVHLVNTSILDKGTAFPVREHECTDGFLEGAARRHAVPNEIGMALSGPQKGAARRTSGSPLWASLSELRTPNP